MKVCSSCTSVLPVDAQRCPHDGAEISSVETLPEGARIGSYRVSRLLGEGGMGFVYEATHDVLGRKAALKLLRVELTTDPGIVIRFLQEAKAVNLISHDHIVDVYDYADGRDGAVYFVMEYLEGETLADVLKARRRFSVALLVHVFSQIMKALAAAHAKQIVHRDLKPANVFVIRREGNPFFVKLLDFGVAKLMGESAISGLTNAGALIGTPQYMSPEQVEGKAADARSDIFALGVMMYRALVGNVPWSGKNFGELAAKVLSEPPPPPRVVAPDVDIPDTLDRMIARALHKNPADRYQRVVDMLSDLDKVRAEANLDPLGVVDETGEFARIDAEEPAERAPSEVGESTAGLAKSLPVYQGADAAAVPPSSARMKLAIGIVLAILACAAAAAVLIRTRGPDTSQAAATATKPAAQPARGSYADDVAAGRVSAAAERAERELQDLLDSTDPADREQAVAALGFAATARSASLVYRALRGSPQHKVRAAEILRELRLPEAAPKIREVLADSGDRLRVDLASSLIALGDRDVTAMLEDALAKEPGQALTAAVALAEAGLGVRARPVLEQVLADTPAGRDRWRMAARGLASLGDSGARDQLRREMANPDPVRAVAAAELLGVVGDPEAVAYLGRVVGDQDFGGRAQAALALARRGDASALDFVGDGLDSDSSDARASAIGVAARLVERGGREHIEAIAVLAANDPDPLVRATAKVGLVSMQ